MTDKEDLVYVVLSGRSEDRNIELVFSTRKLAQEFMGWRQKTDESVVSMGIEVYRLDEEWWREQEEEDHG